MKIYKYKIKDKIIKSIVKNTTYKKIQSIRLLALIIIVFMIMMLLNVRIVNLNKKTLIYLTIKCKIVLNLEIILI